MMFFNHIMYINYILRPDMIFIIKFVSKFQFDIPHAKNAPDMQKRLKLKRCSGVSEKGVQ